MTWESKLSFWYVVLILHSSVDIQSHCFYGQMGTYHSINLSSRHASFMCDKRISLLWKGRRFSFLWGSSWAESKKGNLATIEKKVLEEREKIKWSLKRSEWWKSHKIWQDRFYQFKCLLKKSALKEKPNSAPHSINLAGKLRQELIWKTENKLHEGIFVLAQ